MTLSRLATALAGAPRGGRLVAVASLGLVSSVACVGGGLRFDGSAWVGPRAQAAPAAVEAIDDAALALHQEDVDRAIRRLRTARSLLDGFSEEERRTLLAHHDVGQALRRQLDRHLERTLVPAVCEGAPARRPRKGAGPGAFDCRGRVSDDMFDPLFGADARYTPNVARRSPGEPTSARRTTCAARSARGTSPAPRSSRRGPRARPRSAPRCGRRRRRTAIGASRRSSRPVGRGRPGPR